MDISPITSLISALRAQTSANSITPEGLGSILQKITDLIGALSEIPESEATDLIQRVATCESNCQTALTAAQAANTAAANSEVVTFSSAQNENNVTFTLKQAGFSAYTVTIPAASSQSAGVLTADQLLMLQNANDMSLKRFTISSTDEDVTINYHCEDNSVKKIVLAGATSLLAGLMTAADKASLDSLTTDFTELQALVSDIVNYLEVSVPRMTYSSRRIYPMYCSFVQLDSMGDALDNIDGGDWSFTVAHEKCWFDPSRKKILFWPSGAHGTIPYYNPSPDVIYFNSHTGKCYRWDETNQEMTPWTT